MLTCSPVAEAQGLGDWADAFTKARALVDQMTNEEKNNITYGYSSTTNGCSGNSLGVPRLNFPGLCLADASAGVRGTDMVNAYPGGVQYVFPIFHLPISILSRDTALTPRKQHIWRPWIISRSVYTTYSEQ